MFEDIPYDYEMAKKGDLFPEGLDELDYYRYQAKNQNAVYEFFESKGAYLTSDDYITLHRLLNTGVNTAAGIIDGNRMNQFFLTPFQDSNDPKVHNMVVGPRIQHEMKLLDYQLRDLKSKIKSKEDKIKYIAFQAMRLFSIHPFNDANKRNVKMLVRHFLEKELGIDSHSVKWPKISDSIIAQAVKGDNIGPFAREICKIHGIDYDPEKLSQNEKSKYTIYPDVGYKCKSMDKELKDSMLYSSDESISKSGFVVTEKEIHDCGIKKKFFGNTTISKLSKTKSLQEYSNVLTELFNNKKIDEEQLTKLALRGAYSSDRGLFNQSRIRPIIMAIKDKGQSLTEALNKFDVHVDENEIKTVVEGNSQKKNFSFGTKRRKDLDNSRTMKM